MRARFLIPLFLLIIGEVYSIILVRSTLKNVPNPGKTILFILYILLTFFTWGSFFLFRRIDWAHLPHMARNIFVAFTIGFFVAKMLVGVIMLIDDLRRLVLLLALKIAPPRQEAGVPVTNGLSRSAFFKSLALIVGGSTVGAFLYGITNRYNYQVKKLKLSFKSLPPAFRGLRIVQISDIHAGSFDNKEAVARGVQKILDQKPDIIFFTGDLVNNKAEEIKPYVDVFSKLKAPMGVYSTLGNHDYGDYVEWPDAAQKTANLDELKALHGRMGWKLMMNEHVVFTKGEDRIALIGIENWGAKAGFPKYGDMRKAYAGLPEQNIPFKILLSHDPSHWDAQVVTQYRDVDLTFSGHTHGMQFGVEIPGFKWSPVKYVYKNWAGIYRQGQQHLYVNRGYGFLGYPGRLGIMPEITVIDLV
ncbi:MAG: metallophosphoesterase [Sphingobacteriales bacterium]|nr:MAG: metallophosphoesterase [Sphingobacteriales bacterium]